MATLKERVDKIVLDTIKQQTKNSDDFTADTDFDDVGISPNDRMGYQEPINENLHAAVPSIPTDGLSAQAYANFETIADVQKNVNADVLQAIADLAAGSPNPLMGHVVDLAGHVSSLAEHVSTLAGHVGTMAGHLNSLVTSTKSSVAATASGSQQKGKSKTRR
jgi:hypothetical protein